MQISFTMLFIYGNGLDFSRGGSFKLSPISPPPFVGILADDMEDVRFSSWFMNCIYCFDEAPS